MLDIICHQGNTAMRYNIMLARIAGIKTSDNNEDVEKLEPSYTTGGNVKWHSHFWKTVQKFLKQLKFHS